MYIFWIILAIAFVIIEFGTVALVSVWFVGGSLAAMAVALAEGPLWLQVLLFILVSLILLLLLRPFLRKYVYANTSPTNVDAVIGREALVTEDIDNLAGTGAIKLDGVIWTARSVDNSRIPAGTVVAIQSVQGVKAMVAPAPAFVPNHAS